MIGPSLARSILKVLAWSIGWTCSSRPCPEGEDADGPVQAEADPTEAEDEVDSQEDGGVLMVRGRGSKTRGISMSRIMSRQFIFFFELARLVTFYVDKYVVTTLKRAKIVCIVSKDCTFELSNAILHSEISFPPLSFNRWGHYGL